MEGDFKDGHKILPNPPLQKEGINLEYPVKPGNDKQK
jgi:hypothetical protein